VVFYGVPGRKAFRLVKSPLAHLSGYFPVNTNLVLRIMMYVNNIKNQKWALDTFKSLLAQPFHLGTEAERRWLSEQARFHFRFSLHYLFVKGLLDSEGKCQGMANLITHMPYENCSVYPFVTLMEKGVLNKLCLNFDIEPAETARNVVAILAHFFNRIPLPASTVRTATKKDESSKVILPPLPKEVQHVIDEHNDQTLKCFSEYMRVFCRHMGAKDERFHRASTQTPLSKLYFPPSPIQQALSTEPGSAIDELWREAVSVSSIARSPFVSLSGNGDAYESLEEMGSTVHGAIRLDSQNEPTSSTRDLLFKEIQLNAYASDVFNHRNPRLLMTVNMLDDQTAWQALKDWCTVMGNLCADMKQLMPEMREEEEEKSQFDDDRPTLNLNNRQQSYQIRKERERIKREKEAAREAERLAALGKIVFREPPIYKCFCYIRDVFVELLVDLNKGGFLKAPGA